MEGRSGPASSLTSGRGVALKPSGAHGQKRNLSQLPNIGPLDLVVACLNPLGARCSPLFLASVMRDPPALSFTGVLGNLTFCECSPHGTAFTEERDLLCLQAIGDRVTSYVWKGYANPGLSIKLLSDQLS